MSPATDWSREFLGVQGWYWTQTSVTSSPHLWVVYYYDAQDGSFWKDGKRVSKPKGPGLMWKRIVTYE